MGLTSNTSVPKSLHYHKYWFDIGAMFALRIRRIDITALRLCLRDNGVFRERAARHTTNERIANITTQ